MQLGVSVRRLFGWEPRTHTTYRLTGTWWKPWAWRVTTETVTEPEFNADERFLFLAHLDIESDRGPHGIPYGVATDEANRYKFVTSVPVIDWAAHTLAADQKTYYDRYDTDKKHPMNRAGHMWSIRLVESDNETE